MPSYAEPPGLPPDFRVSYRIFSAEEGGRKTPAHQHSRWDFRYDDPAVSTSTFMIWPEVLLPNGDPVPDGPIPTYGLADMFILLPQARAFHQLHIRPGVRGCFVEGTRRVGACEVVEVLGLHTNPIQIA
ncbi:hypothetical protein [Hymenobacter algoricola]|uniref:Uncharacterized protein n=1 Tax=Hymenobacter algoricola TaxID=486267 RepID=A0ABP7MD35_9BACT